MKMALKCFLFLILFSLSAAAEPKSDKTSDPSKTPEKGNKPADTPKAPDLKSNKVIEYLKQTESPYLKSWESTIEKGFFITPYGYLQVDGFWAQDDPYRVFNGKNDGFRLLNSRIGLITGYKYFSVHLSFDGSMADPANPEDRSPGTRPLHVELRDAYMASTFRTKTTIRLGQAKIPFGNENMVPTVNSLFIFGSLLSTGEDPAFALDVTKPIYDSRQLGLFAEQRFEFKWFYINIYAGIFNGNGANVFANDNNLIAFAARLELGFSKYVILAANVLINNRMDAGEQPNIFKENDIAYGGDITVSYLGLKFVTEYLERRTQFATTNAPQELSYGIRSEIAYNVPIYKGFSLEPAFRFQYFEPSDRIKDDILTYYTIGLNAYYPIHKQHRLKLMINYTFKREQPARELQNDQLDVMLQYSFNGDKET